MWPVSLLSPFRAVAFDTFLSLLRQLPGNRRLQSDKRPHNGVPLFVMMPLDFALPDAWLDHHALEEALTILKQNSVHGIMVDVWWGLCEPTPNDYNFDKYVKLAGLCKRLGLKMQATMCFHACGGNVGDTINIPLPQWVIEATDAKEGWFLDRAQFFQRASAHLSPHLVNKEYISFGLDDLAYLPVSLHSRTATATETNDGSVKHEKPNCEAKNSSNVSQEEPPVNDDGASVASATSMNTDGSLRRNTTVGLAGIQTDPLPAISSPRVRVRASPLETPSPDANNGDINMNGLSSRPAPRLRTPIDCYEDFITEFVTVMGGSNEGGDDFFEQDIITELQVGMGPCGELRYPSYPLGSGKWKFPGIGEFQCYDPHLVKELLRSAVDRDLDPTIFGVPPDGTGTYNDKPWNTSFFSHGYATPAGNFFLEWYSRTLLRHGENILGRIRRNNPDIALAVKVSGVHWMYFTKSRAAEATTGYYISAKYGYNFYKLVAQMLKRNGAILDFTCLEMKTVQQPWREARCGPRQLVRDVFNIAAEEGLLIAGENALECYDWNRYSQIVSAYKWSKCMPHGFTLLRLSPELLKEEHLKNVKRLCEELGGIRPREGASD